MLLFSVFFFFSSRRRHTRYIGDWSSDVCSSDLADLGADLLVEAELGCVRPGGWAGVGRVNVGLMQELRVPVHDPLRLAEPSWISIVGLYPGPGYVKAEVTDDVREQAGAATARTGNEQQDFTHAMFPSHCRLIAESKHHPAWPGAPLHRHPRPLASRRPLPRWGCGEPLRPEHAAPTTSRCGGGVRRHAALLGSRCARPLRGARHAP